MPMYAQGLPSSAQPGLSALHFVGLALLGLALLAAFHVGFQASDDINYVVGALGWLDGFPYVGNSHWTLRHTITVPTAAFIALFGLNGFSVSLSNLLYFVAFVAANAWFVAHFLGRRSAYFVTLLVLTTPGFLVVSTYLNPDIPELFYVTSAFWCLMLALQNDTRRWLWVAAGAIAGLAFVNRQTAAALVIFGLLLWLLSPIVPRSRYWPMVIAFAGVVGAEWLYLTLMTGNPAYRLQVDFNHDPVDRFAEAARVVAQGGWIDKEGNISVNVFIDPVLNLFVSQKYTLLFWLALPAGLAAWHARHPMTTNMRAGTKVAKRSINSGTVLALAAGLGLVFFVFVGANPKLYLVPRYFVVVAWAAALLVGWWLASLWDAGQRWVGGAGMAAMLCANAAALSVENVHPRMVEQALVAWVRGHPGEAIYTDVETRARAEFYFRFAGVSMDPVIAAAPPPGARFFYSEKRVAQCAATKRCRAQASDFRPNPRWKAEQTIEGPRRPGATIAAALGAGRVLPPDIGTRVLAPVDVITIYKIQ